MNKTFTIATIALVAVVMGMSAMTPVMAHNVKSPNGSSGSGECQSGFDAIFVEGLGTHPDHNGNGIICEKITNKINVVQIDDLPAHDIKKPCDPKICE